MTLTFLLAAFILSPANSGGLSPVEFSGDMRADWTNHAATAEACAVDEMPAANILRQWKRLGVRVFRRIAWDPGCSAEFVRRKAGFLAVREGADGVWLADEGKFPETWRKALAEAESDAGAALYCRSLAEEALGWRERDHRVWIEGRRVMWIMRFGDLDTENLDTLRLEFICRAKRLEQLLGKPERDLPLAVSAPIEPDRVAFEPLAGRDVRCVEVSLDDKGPVALSESIVFRRSGTGFGFTISSGTGSKGVWPGGRASFWLYLPDRRGSYLPYEFRIDLSPVEGNRAPTDAYGLWFLRERWGKGALGLYGDSGSWRLKPIARGSYGSKYPCLRPRFNFKWQASGGWTLDLDFTWLSIYGFWPSVVNLADERWFVSMDALPGVKAGGFSMKWGKWCERNLTCFAPCLSSKAIADRYETQVGQVRDAYRRWYEERLYDFAKTDRPTFHRGDAESDTVFWERVVEPMMDANGDLTRFVLPTKSPGGATLPARLEKESAAVKLRVWKSLDRLFGFAERVSAARRDYILTRYAGKMPPEPPKKPEEPAAITAPDADYDGDGLQLDDKEI